MDIIRNSVWLSQGTDLLGKVRISGEILLG